MNDIGWIRYWLIQLWNVVFAQIEQLMILICDKKKQNKPWFDHKCEKANGNNYRVHNNIRFMNSRECEEKMKKKQKNINVFEVNHIKEKCQNTLMLLLQALGI